MTAQRSAFTLMELMIVIAIIAALAAMIMGAVGVLRERGRRVEAQQVVDQLAIALETYQSADQRRHHYPLQSELYPAPAAGLVPHRFALAPQAGASAGVLALLLDQDLLVRGSNALRDGVLTDPWGRPYNYQLTRPAPTAQAARLVDWNWDAANSRPRARNRASGDTAAPFPYIWSYGRAGRADDAGDWIYRADSRP